MAARLTPGEYYMRQLIAKTVRDSAKKERLAQRGGSPVRPSGQSWAIIREAVFAHDEYRCTYCGSDEGPLECDHIVPLARGGTNDRSNLTTSCADCNRSKSARDVAEWRGWRK